MIIDSALVEKDTVAGARLGAGAVEVVWVGELMVRDLSRNSIMDCNKGS